MLPLLVGLSCLVAVTMWTSARDGAVPSTAPARPPKRQELVQVPAGVPASRLIRGELRFEGTPVPGARVTLTRADVGSARWHPCWSHRRWTRCETGQTWHQRVLSALRDRADVTVVAHGVTDARGRFEFAVLGPVGYAVWLIAPGLAAVADVHPGHDELIVEATSSVQLAGRVVGARGEGLANHPVTAIHRSTGRFFETTTGSDGRFRISELVGDEYAVGAVALDGAGGDADAWFGAEDEVVLRLRQRRLLTGIVRSASAPLAGCLVKASTELETVETTSGPDGAFAVAVDRGGAARATCEAEVGEALFDDDEDQVRGLVVDDRTGAPVFGADVRTDSASTSTGTDGRFELQVDDLAEAEVAVTRHSYEAVAVKPPLPQPLEVRLRRGAHTLIEVEGPQVESPVHVQLYATSGSSIWRGMEGSPGQFELYLPPGSYTAYYLSAGKDAALVGELSFTVGAHRPDQRFVLRARPRTGDARAASSP